MKLEELKTLNNELKNPFRKLEYIEKLALEVKNNNQELLNTIKEALENCKTIKGQKENISLCTFVIYILIQSRKPEAMFILIQFIKNLPLSTPYVFVEFLSKVLPSFGKIAVGPLKELIAYPNNSPQHAIGLQSLCNLFLDGLIGDENLPYLVPLLKEFETDIYSSNYLIEMVKATPEYHNFIKQGKTQEFEEDIIIPDDFLVEKEP